MLAQEQRSGSGATLDVLVRSARARAGLSQGELALQAGVTRQAISAIESGKSAPTIGVALRIARALGQRVDELFQLADDLPKVQAEILGDVRVSGTTRVQVGRVGERMVARPLVGSSGAVLTLPRANGLLREAPRNDGRARVELFSDPDLLDRTIVAVGCDPATGLLADHFKRRHPSMDLAWHGGNSLSALEAVARGEAHLAGCHLLDAATGQFNAPIARQVLGQDLYLVTFSIWEQGLIVAAGNPKGIHEVADVARAEVRLANREPGSGARVLLDAELRRSGVDSADVRGYDSVIGSHLAAAEAVAARLADAAIGVQAAAQALGLDFVPLASERYDLVIPARFFELPPVQALLETLTSPLFRLDVEALGGYDVSPMGKVAAVAA